MTTNKESRNERLLGLLCVVQFYKMARAVTKSGTGTWDGDVGLGTRGFGDAGTWDSGTPGRRDAGTRGRGDEGTRGRGDAGTRGRGDVGTWGRGDVGTWDSGCGTRGRHKQTTPDFCAEL